MTSLIKDISAPSWLDHNLFPYQHHIIGILGNTIHFIDEGTGPVLLFLHGNGSWSFGTRYVIPSLSKHFRCIAIDYPGFGLSSARSDYSLKPIEHSQVVEAFVEAMDLRDIRLFVEDWGGPIGLAFASRQPSRIHSLIISNTWAWPAQGIPGLERFSKAAGSSIGWFLITRLNLLVKVAVPKVTMNRTLTPAELAGYVKPYPTSKSREGMAIFPREILASRDYLAKLERDLDLLAHKPVLILWGEGDSGFTSTERERFQSHFPTSEVVLFPKAKHFVLVDEPEKCSQAILEWSARQA